MLELKDKAYHVFRYTEIAIVMLNNYNDCMMNETELREDYNMALEDALSKLSLLVTELRDAINEAADAKKSA